MQLTPDGDCREASFTAKGAGLRVPSLSAVQIEYLAPSGWTPLYYGEVRQGGNARDVNGETYILRSFAQALKEVTLPPGFSAPKQPAHLTVRAIIQAALPQLAGLVLYDAALCPDLGYDCREIKNANQQTVSAFLEQIAEDGAGMGVTVGWGVRPDRHFFFRPARTDTATLSESETLDLQWKPPIAETPYTAVLWFVAQHAGDWLTHLSQSPDAATYRRRVKPLPVMPGVEGIRGSAYTFTATGFWSAPPDRIPAILSGTDPISQYLLLLGQDDTQVIEAVFTLTEPAARLRVDVYFGGTHPGDTARYLELTAPDGRTLRRDAAQYGSTAVGGFLGYMRDTLYAGAVPWPAGTVIRLVSTPDPAQPVGNRLANLSFTRLVPERANAEVLDRLAQHHYSVPASEPADIELATYRAPADLAGRVTLNDYTRAVEAWEYRLTAGRGLTLAALTGQADDPAKLAQAALIKARDGQATITALTAQT